MIQAISSLPLSDLPSMFTIDSLASTAQTSVTQKLASSLCYLLTILLFVR
jgi:hypothetical protein